MTDNLPEKSATSSQILLYQTEDGRSRIEVRLEDETVWLSQDLMAELFQTTKQNISLHIHNIFKEGELDQHSVVKEYLTTASDGKRYKTKFYNLDVIIAVGYRVRSHLSTLLPYHRRSPEVIPRIIFHRSTTIDRLSPGSIYTWLYYAGSAWFYNRCYSKPDDLYHAGRNHPQLLCRDRSYNHFFPSHRNHLCHSAWPHLKDSPDIKFYRVLKVRVVMRGRPRSGVV